MRDRRAPRSLYEHLDFTLGSFPCTQMQCKLCMYGQNSVCEPAPSVGMRCPSLVPLQRFSATFTPSSHRSPPPAARLKALDPYLYDERTTSGRSCLVGAQTALEASSGRIRGGQSENPRQWTCSRSSSLISRKPDPSRWLPVSSKPSPIHLSDLTDF
jgi:hypothetical protein